MDPKKQRLSMIRSYTLADLLTLGNASCGAVTIFLCLGFIARERAADLTAAFILPIVALVFDALDGYVARLNKRRQSLLGADLDSLADIVSFGVAPAVIGFTLGLRGFWDIVCLTYFVCCGISRLARFNVTSASLTNVETGKVKYFEGTPIPTSVFLVILMAVIYRMGLTGENIWWGDVMLLGKLWHPLSLLFVVSGSLMISTIKVPKP